MNAERTPRAAPFDMAQVLGSQTAQAAQPIAVVAGRAATEQEPPPETPTKAAAKPAAKAKAAGTPVLSAVKLQMYVGEITRKSQTAASKHAKFRQAQDDLHDTCYEALEAGVEKSIVEGVLAQHGLVAGWRQQT